MTHVHNTLAKMYSHDTTPTHNTVRSTKAFKEIRSNVLALTFAEIYACVRVTEDKQELWVKAPRPSMTARWTRGLVGRYVQTQRAFAVHRETVFETYERAGGKYMGEPEPTYPRQKRRKIEFSQFDDESDFE